MELRGVEAKHPQEAVLARTRQILAIRGEGELVERPFAHRPAQQRVASRLALAGMHCIVFSLLQELVVRRRGAAGVLHVVQIHAAAGVGHQEQALRTRNPSHTRYSGLVYKSLGGEGQRKRK